jgi:hypothetical protein
MDENFQDKFNRDVVEFLENINNRLNSLEECNSNAYTLLSKISDDLMLITNEMGKSITPDLHEDLVVMNNNVLGVGEKLSETTDIISSNIFELGNALRDLADSYHEHIVEGIRTILDRLD